MVKTLKNYILDNWAEIAPDLKRPNDLSFVILGTRQYWLPYMKTLVLFFRPGDNTPVVVCKTAEDPQFDSLVIREHQNLSLMRELAQSTAAAEAIPRPLAVQKIGRDSVALETGVAGTSLGTIITRNGPKGDERRQALRAAFDSSLAWLMEISSSSIERGGGAAQEVDQALNALVGFYADLYSPEGAEKQAVDAAWQSVHGLLREKLPLLPLHGDYWADNIFMDGPRITGVIDWEYARPRWLPLFDWFQFQFSAATAVSPDRDFGTIFRSAFLSQNETTVEFARTLPEYCRAVGMDCAPELIESLFILWIVETSVRERELFGTSFWWDMARHGNMAAFLEDRTAAPWNQM